MIILYRTNVPCILIIIFVIILCSHAIGGVLTSGFTVCTALLHNIMFVYGTTDEPTIIISICVHELLYIIRSNLI